MESRSFRAIKACAEFDDRSRLYKSEHRYRTIASCGFCEVKSLANHNNPHWQNAKLSISIFL
jgi:hypothetical protein